jgi:catechol 2,3-dioxygenase-like lactoylglutathione lyase family enzyme
MITGIDHVQLAMPKGEEERATAFYQGVLGLKRAPKPPNLAGHGGCWFESAEVRIHLGVDPRFRPATKAHPALLVDDLATLVTAIRAGGYDIIEDEGLEGYDRVFAFDPFGNRIELMQPHPR